MTWNQKTAAMSWLVTGLVTAFLCACGRHEFSLLYLVPHESCAVVIMDWPSVRTSNDLEMLVKGAEIEAVLERLGVESASLKSVVVFSSIDPRTKHGLLLRGSLDKREQLAKLQSLGWQEESLDGHAVYAKGNDYAAMPLTNTVFSGTREGARAVFRALSNERESFLSVPSFRQMDAVITRKSDPVRVFLVIPEAALTIADVSSLVLSMAEFDSIGTLIRDLTAARGFGINIAHEGQQMYAVEICIQARDEKTASKIADFLNTVVRLSNNLPSDKGAQTRPFQNVTLIQKKEVLAMRMNIPRTTASPANNR